MTEMLGGGAFANAAPAAGTTAPATAVGMRRIGALIDIAGSGGTVLLDRDALDGYVGDADPVLASAGSVGAQIKIRVGATWMIANVRSLKLADAGVLAQIDFLG